MQASRKASEVGGWLEDSPELFCFSSLPSYICDVAPSLTPFACPSLTQYSPLFRLFSSPSLFTTYPTPASSFSVSVFQQIVFSSLLLELQPDSSLIPPLSL